MKRRVGQRTLRPPFISLMATVLFMAMLASVLTWGRDLAGRVFIASCRLPVPDGDFAVAQTTLQIPRAQSPRAGLEPFNIDVWYPGELRNQPARASSWRFCSPSSLLRTPRANGIADAPVARAFTKYPALIYVPGWGGHRGDNTFALANLASHGYVVMSFDDIVIDDRRAAPLNRHNIEDFGAFDYSSEQAFAQTRVLANRRLPRMVAKASTVLDRLQELDRAGTPWLLKGRVDFSRIGIFGFSFGGAVASEATLIDSRFSVAINMDGGMVFGRVRKEGVPVPFLALNSDFPDLHSALHSQNDAHRFIAQLTVEDSSNQDRQGKRPDSTIVIIPGTTHTDFSDGLFMNDLRSLITLRYRSSKEQLKLRTTLDEYLLTFLNKYLRVK